MRAAFLWRNKKFNPIGEEDETDFVVIADRAECKQTRDFRSQLALGLRNTSEVPGCADVDNEHHGEFTFLCKFFYECGAQARRHVPVDCANFVTWLVFAHIFKIHSSAFEDAVVIAGERGFDQTARLDFEGPDLFENLGRVHYR